MSGFRPVICAVLFLITGCASIPDPLLVSDIKTIPPLGARIYSGESTMLFEHERPVSWRDLQDIQDEARSGHRYIPDTVEQWEASLVGDCDDYALWIKQRLAQEGIASRLVFVKIPDNGHHLVVEVDGWILDNRYPWVMRHQDLPYEWISAGHLGHDWYAVGGDKKAVDAETAKTHMDQNVQ